MNKTGLTFTYDPSKSTCHIIHDILSNAGETGKEASVARHLIGALL